MTTPAPGGSPFDKAAARTNAAKRQQDEKTKRQQEEADRKKQEQQRCSELEDELLLKISQFFGTEDEPGERLKLVQWLYDIVDGKIDDESRRTGDLVLEALNGNPKATPAHRRKLATIAEGLGKQYDLITGPNKRVVLTYPDMEHLQQAPVAGRPGRQRPQREETSAQTEEEQAARTVQTTPKEEAQEKGEENKTSEPAASPPATPEVSSESSTTEQEAQEVEKEQQQRRRRPDGSRR